MTKYSSAGISYLPISSKLQGETQKAGRQFDYHSELLIVSFVHCTKQDLLKEEVAQCVCILAWAGEVGRGVQLYSLAAWCLGPSVEEVPVSSDSCSPWGTEFNQCFFTCTSYKTHFSLGWIQLWEIKFLDKAAQHVPREVLALPLTVLSPFSSASHFISQSLKSLPQPILPTLSSSEHPSLSGSLLSWVGVDPVLMLVQVKAIRLKLSSPLGVSMLSLSLSTEYLNCQNSFWQSLSVLCFKDQVFPLLFPNQTS